eukprot:137065_1
MSDLLAAQNASDPLWLSSWKEAYGEQTIKKRSKSDSKILLYGSWFCPFVQRVWIALEETGIDYKYIEINPYEVNPKEPGGYTKKQLPIETKTKLYPNFIRSSPRGLVPSFDNNGELIWESLAILEYINQTFNNNGKTELLPMNNPKQCAMIRIWCDYIGTKIQKHFYILLIDQNKDSQIKARANFFNECRKLSEAMDEIGPYFLGKQFSMLDIALAPFWLRYVWVGEYYRNLTFPNDKYFKRLEIWWNAVKNRDSVKNTIVCKERLISSYKQYSKNQATSDFAKGLKKNIKSNQISQVNNDTRSIVSLCGVFMLGFTAGIIFTSWMRKKGKK